MKKIIRITALVLCFAAALFAFSACGSKTTDQSKSPLIGTRIDQEKDQASMTFNTDGTGSLNWPDRSTKFTFADKGNNTYEMTAEKTNNTITMGYRIEGDTLYSINQQLGIEEAYTRKQ